ncbi:MAG: PAS and helix-turn-helix domain-containing protein [Acidobacteria bacterium]|nr:PAS and helix-turn-helix domain-containing protein [Acidobacteriota bacterium]
MSPKPVDDPLDVVASTADAAFATDEEGRVVIWNKAAERLLGRDAASVLGKECHEVICGTDVFGNRFCDANCTLVEMVRRREPIRHFEMDIRTAAGGTPRVSFSILTLPGSRPGRFTLVHIFQPVDRGREADQLIRRILETSPAPRVPALPGNPAPAAPAPASLTGREIEVLRLLSQGVSTEKIADSLFISVSTVRNHVQHILGKLDVHSKLEAVSLALRNRII